MSDITSTEGREAERRHMETRWMPHSEALAALDGLDIAEKAMRALEKAKWSLALLFGLRVFGGSTTTSEHIAHIWDGAKVSAEEAREALAEWDKWTGER